MYAMLRFSLARFSPVFSSSLDKSSQSAVRKFHQGIGAEPVKEISGGVVMRESLCCDLGYLSKIERSGVVPYICVLKVKSGLVLRCHLHKIKEVGWLGSYSESKLVMVAQLARFFSVEIGV